MLAEFNLSEKQAEAILDISLRRLTLLEVCLSLRNTIIGFLFLLLFLLCLPFMMINFCCTSREKNLLTKVNP